jgi:hypothetical protein
VARLPYRERLRPASLRFSIVLAVFVQAIIAVFPFFPLAALAFFLALFLPVGHDLAPYIKFSDSDEKKSGRDC